MRVVVALCVLVFTSAARADFTPVQVAVGSEPQVAISDLGSLYVVYGKDNQVFFTLSRDGAKTFSKPVSIAKVPVLPLGRRRGPRIALVKNAIVVTAVVAQNPKRTDGDLVAWRSTDDGKTWEEVGHVNDMLAAAREGLHDLASDGDQRLFAVWLDLRHDKTELYGSLSRDGGASWEENRLIYKSPDGHICECCNPSAAFDHNGSVFVMFRNWLDGNRDMYLTRSSDAEKFNEPQRLGMLHWKLNACPMDGGDLTIGAMNQPIAIWRQQNAIFLTVSDADEQIGAGRQPVVAVNGSGTYLAWLSPGAELVTKAPGGSAHALTQNANDPVLIAPKEGDRAYLLWESDKKILATVLTPAGQ